jgi:hypothetical protein
MIAQYFAQIDADGVVTDVAVVQREFLEANPDRYQGTWVETFFDRDDKTYAGIGFIYDADLDDFIAPVSDESEGL